tara:strand:- start:2843 stop:3028 length:186 start_codon:yes stop_codon:yes gene_type:complete
MTNHLKELLEKAQKLEVSSESEREQRQSFVFGNTNIENERITREMVAEIDAKMEADELASK